MKILIVGSGGREHALAWKVAQSPQVTQIWVAPGNAGTALEPKVENLQLAADAIPELKAFALKESIDLCIVGPEIALAAGIVDTFMAAGIPCFGPTQAAARLESSKAFSKAFMQLHGIPTADSATFTSTQPALDYLKTQRFPIVIKADGLAQGKGVVIAQDYQEAEETVESMLNQQSFGSAGATIVIEEFLDGEELSFIALVDGKNILPLASSQDHKRRDDGDLGPNTGGMGAYSPSPLSTAALEQMIIEQVLRPVVDGMAAEGTIYIGFLYAGLMIDKAGKAWVLEFNCRLGDPETQPLLMRLKSDLVELCLLALKGQLDTAKIEWDPRPALGVVMCTGGYPASYPKDLPIEGLEDLQNFKDLKVFHAGTRLEGSKILANGGRVLCVTALGNTVKEAQKWAYEGCQKIQWASCFYRRDIGHRAID